MFSAERHLKRRGGGRAAAVALLAILPIDLSAQVSQPLQLDKFAATGSASRGTQLFTGATHFRNQGPACISCHSIAGLPFPNGGTLGPDLTHAYKKLGRRGTESAMQTLYFQVMTPIYSVHTLDPDEQADLMAFLEQAEAKPEPQWNTQIILVASLLLGGVLLALTGFLWRDRIKSVRQTLIYKATGQGARF
jgi:mono/diheme cytochrome c family protein